MEMEITKKCNECLENKDIEEFSKRKCYKDGHINICKTCMKIKNSEYYQNNKEHLNDINKKWIKNNKEKADNICKKYRDSEKRKKIAREWARKPENRKKQYEYWNNKYKNDPQFNIKIKLRRRIHSALNQRKISKSNSTIKLLGCTYSEFEEYICGKFTEGMTWEKVLNSEIHLDHIKPCDLFNLENEDEQKICFHYTNIQPLWKKDNLSKSNKF